MEAKRIWTERSHPADSEATTEWRLADSVVQLFYPQYNGQLERSNAMNKTYTHQRAAAEGHPHRWAEEDLQYARTLTNTISRPWGHKDPTPDEAWQARATITDEERAEFAAEVTGQHARLITERAQATVPTAEEADDFQRRAVAGALEACGYLTREEVRNAPRPRKRQPRDSPERRPRHFREQPAETIEQATDTIGQPGATIGQPDAVPVKPSDLPDNVTLLPAAVKSRSEAELPGPLLDYATSVGAMQTASEPSALHHDPVPPDTTAQRERSNSTWWRKPITLLLTLTKAAKISS